MATQAEATTTSKKRKCHLVFGGPSGSQAPKVVSTPPLTSIPIPVVDLDGDVEGSSPVPALRVPTMVTQAATPSATSQVPVIEAHAIALEAPTPCCDNCDLNSSGVFFYPSPSTREASIGARYLVTKA